MLRRVFFILGLFGLFVTLAPAQIQKTFEGNPELTFFAEDIMAILAPAQMQKAHHDNRNLTFFLEDVIPHIAIGGVWSTTIQLVNLGLSPAGTTIHFWTQQGTPWVVSAQGRGSGSQFPISIPIFGSVVLELTSGTPDIRVGWAEIEQPLNTTIGGHAIFRDNGSPGRPIPFEAVVPLGDDAEGSNETLPDGTQIRIFFIPFDNTRGFNTCIAVVNPSGFSVGGFGVLGASENGDLLPGQVTEQQTFFLSPRAHTSFCLRDRFPVLDGRRGTLLMVRPSNVFDLSALAFRFDPQGAFTTFLPMSGF